MSKTKPTFPRAKATFFQSRCAFALRQVLDPLIWRYDRNRYKEPWVELYQDKAGNLIVASGNRAWSDLRSEGRRIDSEGQFERFSFTDIPDEWKRVEWPELTATARKSAAPVFDLGKEQNVSQLKLWQEILLGKMEVRKKGMTRDRLRVERIYYDAVTAPEFLSWAAGRFFAHPNNIGGYRGIPGVRGKEKEISYNDFGFIYRKTPTPLASLKALALPQPKEAMINRRFSPAFALKLSQITTWPEQFQGRKSDYSKETVNKILSEGYDKSQDPIVVWSMPADKRNGQAYVVLSGHSRFHAAQILYERGQKDLFKIPAKEFKGTLEEAVEFAVVESNRSGTSEGLASDVAAVRMALTKGKNKTYLEKYFKPAGYLRKLMDLVPLSPKGKFFTNLDSDARHHFPHLERNARWVGTMRRQIPELKDFHEDELFNYFYPLNKSKREVKKEKIFDLVNKTVSSLMWSFDQPLQLEKAARTKAVLQPGAEQLRELEKEQQGYQTRREKLEEKLAKAEKEDNQNAIKRLEGQISDLNKLILRVIQDKQKVEREMGKLERKTTHDLFSQPSTQPKRKPMKKPKLEVVAADAKKEVQVQTYDDGVQKGVEIHFVDSPSPFALQMLKNSKFQLAFRDGKPYQFRPFSRSALKDAKQIATVHTRTKEMAEKEVNAVKSQQKKGAVFVTKEKELSNRPIEGSFKLPELEAAKKKAVGKKKARAKKAEPAKANPTRAKKQAARPKVGVTRKPRKPKASKTETFSTGARQIGAGDVQKMKFPLISVPGGIGEWLGGIDRNGLAITIRGEKGSGKSHLMYQFAEAFQAMGWKGAVFTLEEGIGATTQQKVAQYGLTNVVKLIEEPYLEEIRTAARRNDFVMIDSWGKTDGSMKDFDQLRKDFPQTVFVVIFQENQAGKVRGGSSFEYDAVITIETEKVEEDKKVLDRIALITKSRYDSKHIYSIQNQTVLQ